MLLLFALIMIEYLLNLQGHNIILLEFVKFLIFFQSYPPKIEVFHK